MNTILKLIEQRGGIEKLIEIGHFRIAIGLKVIMPLYIDFLGTGPHGHPMIAVAHNYIQNGDIMADPNMQCEIVPTPYDPSIVELEPLTFRQDSIGLYHSIYELDENGKAKGYRPKLQKELRTFLKLWSINLKNQGFLKVLK